MKPYMRGPGECVDRKGVPIYPGDLLKTFHFTGARQKKHWLYHFATMKDGAMWMINISNFGPTNFILDGVGNCLLSDDLAAGVEVIAGSGPKPYLDFSDRPKRTNDKQCNADGENASQSLYGQADAYRDVAKRLRVILSKPPLCDHCGAKATCRGSYEGSPIMFGCDECCGHGNEDGACVKLQGAS